MHWIFEKAFHAIQATNILTQSTGVQNNSIKLSALVVFLLRFPSSISHVVVVISIEFWFYDTITMIY